MPHDRKRYLLERVKKLATLWPVVGVIGARQVGKSTLLRDQLAIENALTFDDDDVRSDAEASAKAFLAKQNRPLLIDEAQKVPNIFDAIKSEVDKKRIPGNFFITGSSQFSARIGIRESLTGRIGVLNLLPMTIAEAKNLDCLTDQGGFGPIMPSRKLPFDIAQVARHMVRGGMPVPMFLRDDSMATNYWSGWLDTTIYRDLQKFFTRAYDPEFAFRILKKMSQAMSEGELPTIKNFEGGHQKIKSYLEALEQIFVIRRIPIHPKGVGLDGYLFFDSGLAAFMMGKMHGEGASLTLARHFVWQETSAYLAYSGQRDDRVYYKSARGTPVDMIWNDVAIKVTHESKSNAWIERATIGALKTLNLKQALIVAPVDQVFVPKTGIGTVPWSYWS